MAHDPRLTEAVARGLCREDGKDPDDSIGIGVCDWTFYREPATAALDAIEAMGCVVVPVEPTPEMVAAGAASDWLGEFMDPDEAGQDVYRAMLAARPGAQP